MQDGDGVMRPKARVRSTVGRAPPDEGLVGSEVVLCNVAHYN